MKNSNQRLTFMLVTGAHLCIIKMYPQDNKHNNMFKLSVSRRETHIDLEPMWSCTCLHAHMLHYTHSQLNCCTNGSMEEDRKLDHAICGGWKTISWEKNWEERRMRKRETGKAWRKGGKGVIDKTEIYESRWVWGDGSSCNDRLWGGAGWREAKDEGWEGFVPV